MKVAHGTAYRIDGHMYAMIKDHEGGHTSYRMTAEAALAFARDLNQIAQLMNDPNRWRRVGDEPPPIGMMVRIKGLKNPIRFGAQNHINPTDDAEWRYAHP